MLTERALKAVARRAIRLIEERGFRRGKCGPGLCVGDAICIELLRRVVRNDVPFTHRDARSLLVVA